MKTRKTIVALLMPSFAVSLACGSDLSASKGLLNSDSTAARMDMRRLGANVKAKPADVSDEGYQNEQSRRAPRVAVITDNNKIADNSLTVLTRVAEGDGEEATTGSQRPLNEVVVTAQRREENLKDVPISITVVDGENLDRLNVPGTVDVLRSVPGVAITSSRTAGASSITIRGVGAVNSSFSGGNTIGYYMDGIPFSFPKTPLVPNTNAYDLDRIEVLRGPQGTLYGASSLNGVVNLVTKDPDLNRFQFKGRASASDTNGSGSSDGGGNYRGDFALNVPLVDGKLAVRAVAGYEDVSGWINSPVRKNVNNGELKNFRLKVKGQPSDSLSVDLSAWRSETKYGAPSGLSVDTGLYPVNLSNPVTFSNPNSSEYDGYALHVSYDFSAFSISSTTSYLDYLQQGSFGTLFSSFTMESLAQEFVVNSRGDGLLRWSGGAIYRDIDGGLYQNVTPSFPTPIDFYDTSKSYAGFGQVTRVLAKGRLELTGGLRYFHDNVASGENVAFFPPPQGRLLYRSQNSFDSVTPRAVATWHVNDDVMAYASYSQGFRSGFDQYGTVKLANPSYPAVDADKLTNYEVGTKADLLDRKLFIDASVYFMDWKKVQQSLGIFFNGSCCVSAPINGSSASGVGFDVGLSVAPTNNLKFALNFSVNDLTQDRDVINASTTGSVVLFKKGDRLVLSPKYTAGASVEYYVALGGSGLGARFRCDANYTSTVETRSALGSTVQVFSGDDLLTSRASVAIDSGKAWAVTLFAENLNNETGYVTRANPGDASFPLTPRTIGLQFDFHL